VLTGLAVALMASMVGAQTLGERAAEEKAKREQKAREGKPRPRVFTNADLGEEKASPGEVSSAAESAPSPDSDNDGWPRGRVGESDDESETDRSGRSGESDESDISAWKARVAHARSALTSARTRVANAQKRIEELNARLNPASASYEQDTFEAGESGLTSRHAALREELVNTESELGQARHDLEEAEQAWRDFVREALSEGAPSFLLREPER